MARTNGPLEVGDIRIVEDTPPDYLSMAKATMSDAKAAELSKFAAGLPEGTSADAVLAAFRTGAVADSDATESVIGAVDGKKPPATPAAPEEDEDGWFKNSLQAVSRTAIGVASLPGEIAKGGFEAMIGAATGRNMMGADGSAWNDVLESTSLWQQLSSFEDQGSGWFLGGQAAENQERERTEVLYRQVKTKNAAGHDVVAIVPSSLGTEWAKAVGFADGSTGFKWASGIADFTTSVALDPLTLLTLGTSATAKNIGTLGKYAGVGAASKQGRMARSGQTAAMTEVAAETAGKARDAAKAAAIQDVIHDSDAANEALARSLEEDVKQIEAIAEADRTTGDIARLRDLTDRMYAARVVRSSAQRTAKDAEINETFHNSINEFWNAAGAESKTLHEQVAFVEQVLKDSVQKRLDALDEEISQGEHSLLRLQEDHRQAVDLLDKVLNPSRANAELSGTWQAYLDPPGMIDRDAESVFDATREALQPRPGPAARRAEAVAASATSTPAQVQAAAKAAERASRQEVVRAKATEAAVDHAKRAYSVLESRQSLARRMGDDDLVQQLEGTKTQMLTQTRMLQWPVENVKDQVGRTKALSDIASGVYKRWGQETAELARQHVEDTAEKVTKAVHRQDQMVLFRGVEPEEYMPETAGGSESFHGTSRKLPEGGPTSQHSNVLNLFGDGFYTTDDVNVADSYRGKDAASAESAGEHFPTIYQAEALEDVKFFDLDAPVPDEVKEALKEEVYSPERKRLDDLTMSGDEYGTDYEMMVTGTLNDLFNGEITTLAEVMGGARQHLVDMYAVQTFYDSIRHTLTKMGYGGFTHKGGIYSTTGNGPTHQVRIYWRPEEQIKVSEWTKPTTLGIKGSAEKQFKYEADTAIEGLGAQSAKKGERIQQELVAGTEGAEVVRDWSLNASLDEALAAEGDAARAADEAFGTHVRYLRATREAREADAVAAGRALEAANTELSETVKRLQPKIELLRTAYGLHDEVTRLLNGDTAPLREAMDEALGRSSFDGFDWEKFSHALFGKKASMSVSLLAAEENAAVIWRAMGRKVHLDVATQVALAKTEDEVLDVLAKAVGARSGITGPINGFGMKVWRNMLPTETTRFASVVAGVNRAAFNAYAASERVVPWAHELHLEDTQSIGLALDDWLNMAIGTTARSRMGRRETRDMITGIIDEVAKAPDVFARRQVMQASLKMVAQKMATANGLGEGSEFQRHLDAAFNNAFETMNPGKGSKSNFLTVGTAMPKGEKINGVSLLNKRVPRHLAQLSEFFRLPDVKEVQKIIRQGKKYNDVSGLRDKVSDFLLFSVDRLFRTAMLVGRPAYIIRNVGEALFRQYLNGSLQDPFTLVAMAMRHSKDRRFLSKFDAYEHTVMGDEMRTFADEANDLGRMDAEMRAAMYRANSVMDPGFQKKLGSNSQGTPLNPDDRNYVKAWTHQLAMLRADQVTFDAVMAASGNMTKRVREFADSRGITDAREATLAFYNEGPGRAVFERLAVERPEHWGRMLDAGKRTDEDAIRAALKTGHWSIDPVALEQVLFTHSGSFVNEARLFLADMQPELARAWFAGDEKAILAAATSLRKSGSASLPEQVWWAGASSSAADAESLMTKFTDRFFHAAAVVEGAVNFAPETRVAYWNKVEELLPFLEPAEQARLMEVAEKSLKPLVVGGKTWGLTKAMRMYKRMEATAAKGSKGVLGREEVHALAAQHAVRETAALFYDGYKKKQHWYAMRLMFPFGQAWSNTMVKWSELATSPKGGIRVLGLKKAYDSFSGGYSNDTEEEWENKKQAILNDPAQRPLLYKDPGTGQIVMDVPFVDPITKLFGAPAGTVMPLASLNVATGSGVPLPGLGPVLTLPAKMMMNATDMEKFTDTWVERWIEPFPSGTNDGAVRAVYESFTAAWMRRVMAAADPQYGDQEIQSMTPSLMTYLVSAHMGRYTNEAGVFTEEGKNLLAEDTTRLARRMSLYRGVSQAILPGTALYRWKIETGDESDPTQMAAQLDYNRMMADNGHDMGAAMKEFEDTYGPGTILTVLGKYKGDFQPTTTAAEYFGANEGDLTKYPTVAGFFFPRDGSFSPSFDAALRRRDLKEQRTPEELMDQADQNRYYLIRSTLQEKVDLGQITEDEMSSEMKRLSEDFGVTYNAALRADQEGRIRELRSALADQSSNLKDTEAGQAAAQYMALRDMALEKLNASGVATSLKDKDAGPLKQYLYGKGTELVEQSPDFARMWQIMFEREVA